MEGLHILKINLSKRFLIRLNTNYNTIQSNNDLYTKKRVSFYYKWIILLKD